MAQVEKLRIRAEDGAESDATLFTPDPGRPVEAVLVCTPAMGVPARFYQPLAQELAERGLGIVVAELRGIGSSSVRARRGVDFGYRELAFLDLPAVLARTREVYPELPVFLMGHSLGGQVSVLYASARPERVQGLILIAAGSPHFLNWRFPANLGVLASSQLMRGISSALGYFPGRRLGFGGQEARRLIHEWASVAARGRFQLASVPDDLEARMRQLTLPLLALSFDDDGLAPKRAVDHLVAKMPGARVTRRHLRPSEVGVAQLNHFQWAKQPGPIAELIGEWLRTR